MFVYFFFLFVHILFLTEDPTPGEPALLPYSPLPPPHVLFLLSPWRGGTDLFVCYFFICGRNFTLTILLLVHMYFH